MQPLLTHRSHSTMVAPHICRIVIKKTQVLVLKLPDTKLMCDIIILFYALIVIIDIDICIMLDILWCTSGDWIIKQDG